MTKTELIQFLKTAGIEVEVEGIEVKVRGQVYYASNGYVSEIAISNGNIKVTFEEFSEVNRITIENGEKRYYAHTYKNIIAYYWYTHLVFRVFSFD
jgi:hypothetical protein